LREIRTDLWVFWNGLWSMDHSAIYGMDQEGEGAPAHDLFRSISGGGFR